jgi:chromosome segregation ATPase
MAEHQVAELPNIAGDLEPALVVNVGTSANRRRPLAPTTTLVGRGRTCDIRLEAPEVGNLHCVLTRANGAVSLRDCESLSGTLINGKPVKEAVLHDGDSLQVGPFSFTLSIPVVEASVVADRSSVELDEMRSRCEQLARECESLRTLPPFHGGASSGDESIDQLREQVRRAEERAKELEGRLTVSQKGLEEERQRIKTLTQEAVAQFRSAQEEKKALLAEIETYKHAAAPAEDYPGELLQLRKEAESLRAQVIDLRDRRPLSQPLFTPPADLAEYEKQLLEFRDQLEARTAVVEGLLEPMRADLAAMTEKYEQAAAECERLRSIPGGATSALLSDARARSADVEDLEGRYYRAQQELVQLHDRLEREHNDSEARLASLQRELEQERMRIKDMVKEAAGQFKAARSESEVLKKQLEQSRSSSVSMEQFPGELEVLRNEVQTLRAQVSSGPVSAASSQDLEQYEQQLNDFREQLESANAAQSAKEQELDERLRHAEVQLSKERAEIAREKSMLERMRNEVKTELMHAEREAKNFERMAPFHKLANEVRQVKPGEGDAGATLSERIRGFLRRFGEG